MFEKPYDEQLNKTLTMLKSGYLLISSLIIIRGIIETYSSSWTEQHLLLVSVVSSIIAVVISIVYSRLSLSDFHVKKYFSKTNILITESIVLLFISMLLIWYTNKNESYFLIAFLLVLFPVTIQIGARHAFLITGILSAYIISMDYFFSSSIISIRFIEKDLIAIAVLFITTWILGRLSKTDRDRIALLEERANLDGLTGLYNHRYFHNSLRAEVNSCLYLEQPLTLLFLDIDSFKEFNDMFGHLNGDRILRKIAALLMENKPTGTILARYGGDEFAAIMPNNTKENARVYGEKIREAVEILDLTKLVKADNPEKSKILHSSRLTISVGIAQWGKHTENGFTLIKNADDALYRAKLFRKNRVEIYDSILDAIELDFDKDDYDLLSSLQALINIINARDRYTSGHVERVVMYSKALSKQLKLNADERKSLSLAAYMHDIGKVNLSEQVLNKSTPLKNEEWQDIKEHSVVGAHILQEVAALANIAPLVLHHHERYDGCGYPQHLKGEEIPYLSRVLTIVDSFDAMTFDRPYKAAMSWREAIVELRANKGTQFDPDIVDSFVKLVEDSLDKDPSIRDLSGITGN